MWKWYFILWSLALVSCGRCQYLSRQELAPATPGHDDGAGWDIRLAVPGEPGRDYPTLGSIPKTGFTCAGKKAGYYADVETNCQVFRVCTIGATYGFQSFLCPNGTLFNQAVFVCDWWMNVNCQGSQRYYSNNNEKFGNLRLGPSMMTDIKKMLTYSMNNPYRNNDLNGNQYITQIYNPPSGQPFSSSGTLSDNLRNEFLPSQQLQLPALQQNTDRYNENQFSGSTPSPQYVPVNRDPNGQLAQLQNGQIIYNQNGQCVNCQKNGVSTSSNDSAQRFGLLRNEETENSFSQNANGQNINVHSGHFTNGHNHNTQLHSQFSNAANSQFQNGLTGSQKYQFSNTLTSAKDVQSNTYNNNEHQSGKLVDISNNFNNQYHNNEPKVQNSGGRQNELEITFTKQQYTYPSQYDKQYTYKVPNNQAINGQQIGHLQEVKQNLVSEPSLQQNPTVPVNTISQYSPPNIVTKTLTINKEVKSGKLLSPNAPSSRITFKTWVVQPSKSAQLNSKQGPYKYERPKSSRQYLAPQTPRPTVSSRLYLTPSTPRPTVSSRLYLAPTPTRPTPSSRLYLAPTTSRPTSLPRLYLAPSTPKPTISSRQYLTPPVSKPTQSARLYSYPKPPVSARLTAPSSSSLPIFNRNSQLHAVASTASPVYLAPLSSDRKNQSITITKHSHINTNHNNLTFTDILTKEKLDITVDNIVKDTSNFLENNSVNKLGQLRDHGRGNDEEIYASPIYVPTQSSRVLNATQNNHPHNELIATASTIKPDRLSKDPSSSLELPVETFRNGGTNQIVNLPYFKQKDYQSETATEKTVSIKISLPEKTAQYILRSNNESEFDRLEILNTGSSNYLVLTNGRLSNRRNPNFIPLGKLVVDKNVNVSNPQAFAYDFLSNSINAAKTYENTLNENIKKFNLATTQTFGQQFENIDAEDFNEISKKISQLTTAQYNNNFSNNQFQKANLVSSPQTTTNTGDTYRGITKFTNGITKTNNQEASQIQNEQFGPNNEVSGNYYSSNFYSGNNGPSAKLQVNPNEVIRNEPFYQVPGVISQNNLKEQSSSHSAFTDSAREQNFELNELQQQHQNIATDAVNTNPTESDEVELVETGLQQSASPAKLQVAPTTTASESSSKAVGDNINRENGIGAQFHKQIVGAINHPISDKNLVTYKADRSFYFYTKYLGSHENNLGAKQLGELRQIQQSNDNSNSDQRIRNPSDQITTVQFIPSLGFQLDDENDQKDLIRTLQNQQGSSAAYTSGAENEDLERLTHNEPTSSIDYSVQHTVPTKEAALQQYRNSPTNLYAGPSSYSAPQSSVGRLELPQNAQLNLAPSPTSSGYVPARLEDFEDTAGYPKVTPAIPFSF